MVQLRELLSTRARKAFVAGVALVLGGIGVGIYGSLQGGIERTTKRILKGGPGAPLQVTVARPGTFFSAHPWAPYYVMPRRRIATPSAVPASAHPSGGSSNDFLDYAWVRANGGVAGSAQVVRLQLRGKNDEPVVITAIQPEIVARKPALKGWYLASPGCGAEPLRIADFDLDHPKRFVGYVDAEGRESKTLAISITRTDPELVEIHATTRKSLIDWRAKISYSATGGDGQITIDDEGHPFRVSTETASDGYSPDFADSGEVTFKRRHAWDGKGIVAC